MAYELKLETYQGPLDKLLELIEGKKLEITRLNLAEVTADFLDYVAKLEKEEEGKGIPPGILADFLVVASRLILMKSKALLPNLALSEEEEGEVADLEYRLKLYRELKEAQKHVSRGWSPSPLMASREFLMASETFFYPPQKLSPEKFLAAVAHVVGELERFAKPTAHIRSTIIDLKKKIEEMLKRVAGAPFRFQELRRGKERGELVVLFLAVLHLLKTQEVRAEQREHFGDIIVAKRAGNA